MSKRLSKLIKTRGKRVKIIQIVSFLIVIKNDPNCIIQSQSQNGSNCIKRRNWVKVSHADFLSHFEEFSYDLISRREMTRVLSFENTELPSFSESSKCVVRNEDNNFNDFFNIAFKIPQLISSSFYWVKLLHCIVPKLVRSSLPHCSTGSIVHTSSIPMVGQKSKTTKPANFQLVFI